MKMDLSKFKKISSDKTSTTLEHPDGHTMKIDHRRVHAKLRQQLMDLPAVENKSANVKVEKPRSVEPINMAEGGMVPYMKENYSKKKTQKFAEGGMADGDAPMMEEPAPVVDPILAMKRERYNQLVGASDQGPGLSTPRSEAIVDDTVGSNFKPEVWAHASQQVDLEAQAAAEQEQKNMMAANQNAMAQNAARSQAGLPSVEVPAPGLMAPAPQAAPITERAPSGLQSGLQPALPQQTQQQSPGMSDPYGAQTQSDAMMRGLNEQKQGLGLEAKAIADRSAVEAAALAKAQENQQKNISDYQQQFKALEEENNKFRKDIEDQHIDPRRYVESMSTGKRVMTTIGLIMSGFAAGVTGGENLAFKMLNKQIDMDIEAQKAELGRKESLLNMNMRKFGNLKDATEMTRLQVSDMLSAQLRQAAANAAGPEARARLLQEAGKIDQASAPLLGQMAMRKTLLGAANNGRVAPENVIRAIVPQGEQQSYYKELKEAQEVVKARDNVLGGFDKLTTVQKIGNRVVEPWQSKSQVEAIKGLIIPALSKQTAGRYTEQDAKVLEEAFPKPGDDQKTIQLKRAKLQQLVDEKLNFPMLKSIGLDLAGSGRYDSTGRMKITETAPSLPKK